MVLPPHVLQSRATTEEGNMSEQELIYCANGACGDEAHFRTGLGTPLCYTCCQAYELGQASHADASPVERYLTW